MSYYSNIYYNLCESKKQYKKNYGPGSGLHRHHIIPIHCGGIDCDSNYTYLTNREHIIAHFLLWKINGNINDLRSMHMLGANLTTTQRQKIGKWCYENKIGIFGATQEEKKQWVDNIRHIRREIGYNSMRNKTGLFGISKEQKKEAIEKALQTQKRLHDETGAKNFYYWYTPAGRKERSTLGGILSSKYPATNDIITKKFHTEEDREFFLSANPDWKIGQHWNNGKGKGYDNIKMRKKVTDGKVVYDSVKAAAEAYNITSGAVVGRCKSNSKRFPNWNYVS